MTNRSIVLIGGPDTGKTNYIGRLWLALQSAGSALVARGLPERIEYVEQVVAHLHKGRFAPRTDKNLELVSGKVVLPLAADSLRRGQASELVIPDVSGEIWKDAVDTRDLAPEWMQQLEGAFGAMVFVRVLSKLNVDPLDWVTAARLMRHQGSDAQPSKMPTQVMLCEFIRFVEEKLHRDFDTQKPRVAVIVTAWDLLDSERSKAGQVAYIEKEYPLFFGRIEHLEGFDVMVFGMSILGGDVKTDDRFRDHLLASDFQSSGYVVYCSDGQVKKKSDLTIPVAWALGDSHIA